MGLSKERAEKIRSYILKHENHFSVVGSVCKTYVRCGKPNCKCARGQKHGPYYSLYWRFPDGETYRFYLGGPEEAEVARQTLLEIRRKAWRGYDHYWLYRRSLTRGLDSCGAFGKFIADPTSKNFARMMALDREMDAIKGGQLRGTTKRKPRRKGSEGQSRPKTDELEDDELTRMILEAKARKLRQEFFRIMGG